MTAKASKSLHALLDKMADSIAENRRRIEALELNADPKPVTVNVVDARKRKTK